MDYTFSGKNGRWGHTLKHKAREMGYIRDGLDAERIVLSLQAFDSVSTDAIRKLVAIGGATWLAEHLNGAWDAGGRRCDCNGCFAFYDVVDSIRRSNDGG